MAAVKHDPTMLFTNATLDLISSVILGASFGVGMMLAAPVLFCWQGGDLPGGKVPVDELF